MASKLFVGNLPFTATENDLQDHFAGAGTVIAVNIMQDRATGRSRGFAFVEMGSQAEADAAKALPIVVVPQAIPGTATAPYFVEEVRKYLEHKYGARGLYEAGMAVYTTLDAPLQQAAARALDKGLRQLDKRRGFRRPEHNLLAEKRNIDDYRDRLRADAWPAVTGKQ